MPLSHESACRRALSMVVSHRTLMHRSPEWFSRQPQTLWVCRPVVVEGWSTPRALRGVRQVEDWALGRDHTWRAPTMPNGMRWVGLDVHAHASAVAVFDDVTGELITRHVNGRPMTVLVILSELPGRVRSAYEAGPP